METCSRCGAEKVRNPKTGKMFCKDKCWLKIDTQTSEEYPDKWHKETPLPITTVEEIISRLDSIESGVKITNDRLDKLGIYLREQEVKK